MNIVYSIITTMLIGVPSYFQNTYFFDEFIKPNNSFCFRRKL